MRVHAFLMSIAFGTAILVAPGVAHAEAVRTDSGSARLSLLLLIDSSGSMRENDPKELRKAAIEAIASLLSPEDELVLAEFDSLARSLVEGERWLKPEETGVLLEAVSRVGDSGGFTDFRAALEYATRLFEGVAEDRRKVVLLLTDGVLEPNPRDSTYAPHHLEYRMRTAGVKRETRRNINQEFRERLAPIARRILDERILPDLRARNVELFAVALGSGADQSLLQTFVDRTTRNPVEVHLFHAERATDLLDTFAQFIEYCTDQMVLRRVDETIVPGRFDSIFLDELIDRPQVLTLVDGEGEFVLRSERGGELRAAPGVHPNVSRFELSSQALPGTWTYGFTAGAGVYRSLWIGKSLLRLELTGLKSEYRFGEIVEGLVRLRVGAGKALLSTGTGVGATVQRVGPSSGRNEQLELTRKEDAYELRYTPPVSGVYELQLFAQARDRQGRELLPRPSLRYGFQVRPAFYVTPDDLNFGNARGGSTVVRTVTLRSGLENPVALSVSGRIIHATREIDNDAAKSRLPGIVPRELLVNPGDVVEEAVSIELPQSVLWGDYEGVISFDAAGGDIYDIGFRIHVPSLWEKLTIPSLLIVLTLLALVAYLAYVWGMLGSPVGVLVPLEAPGGEILTSISLGEVRRGLFTRYLNWRRYLLRIARSRGDINLRRLPSALVAELAFTRGRRVYLRNQSPSDSGIWLSVEEPSMGGIKLKPGERLAIRHRAVISLKDYKYRYERG